MNVDERVMNELVGRKIPIEAFEEEIEKVLKQKSGAKLLISNKFLNLNETWITENLQKYFYVENWKNYRVDPRKIRLGDIIKITFTNEGAQKKTV